MPLPVNSVVGSSCGISGARGITVWPRSAMYSRNARRIWSASMTRSHTRDGGPVRRSAKGAQE